MYHKVFDSVSAAATESSTLLIVYQLSASNSYTGCAVILFGNNKFCMLLLSCLIEIYKPSNYHVKFDNEVTFIIQTLHLMMN